MNETRILIRDRQVVKTSSDTVGVNFPIQYVKDGKIKVGDKIDMEVTVRPAEASDE